MGRRRLAYPPRSSWDLGISAITFGVGLALSACGGERGTESPGEPELGDAAVWNRSDSGVAPSWEPAEQEAAGERRAEGDSEVCAAAPDAHGIPTTIVEIVERINRLPKPVTIECFLQSLPRPLHIFATLSVISAQPAAGQDSPRIFVLGDGISLSVVPDGEYRDLLEVGEMSSATRSIKAEIEFPVTEDLSLEAPFERILRPAGGTVCYTCHHGEESVKDYPATLAFDSIAYRPIPSLEVNFDYLKYQHATCDAESGAARCAFLSALFDHGEVVRGEFSPELPLFQ